MTPGHTVHRFSIDSEETGMVGATGAEAIYEAKGSVGMEGVLNEAEASVGTTSVVGTTGAVGTTGVEAMDEAEQPVRTRGEVWATGMGTIDEPTRAATALAATAVGTTVVEFTVMQAATGTRPTLETTTLIIEPGPDCGKSVLCIWVICVGCDRTGLSASESLYVGESECPTFGVTVGSSCMI